MRCSRVLGALAALACGTLPLASGAHHSFSAHFQMDSVVEIEGRVTDLDWVNPHIKFQVEGTDGQRWEVEAGPVNLVSRMGIEKRMFAVGSTLRVLGNPGRDDAKTLWASNVLLQNGTELLVAPGARPHWGANALGDASAFLAAGASKLPDGSERTFFRIWSPPISAFPRPRGAAALTDEGRRAQARYETGRQVVTDCEVPGMPFAMMSPYPIELVDQGERILLRGEAYDLRRTIYLGAPPAGGGSTPLGTSRGRFAGDELIVETDGIDYHSYGDLGPAQSKQSTVVERFKLSADGLTLDYEITITDPVILAEPWAWGGSFVVRDGAEIRPWNCGADRG